EAHRSAPTGFLVDVGDSRAADERLARADRAVHLELLLAVEQARDVGAELAQELAAVAGRFPERGHERGRRNELAPLGGLAHAVVQGGRVVVADGAGELLDLAPLDRHDERRELPADESLVDLIRHQAAPFFITPSRNFMRSGNKAP